MKTTAAEMAARRSRRRPGRRPGPPGNVRYPGAPVRLTRRGRAVVLAVLTLVTLGALWLAPRVDATLGVGYPGCADSSRAPAPGDAAPWRAAP
ncbi:hypothetical protein ACWDTT_32815 [Streptosporangium sandarakinum]|uniref:hypothetical protein n=1 Tax=Streptosporangium sandarakinum TaxID=1260955 RepID=UPI0036820063